MHINSYSTAIPDRNREGAPQSQFINKSFLSLVGSLCYTAKVFSCTKCSCISSTNFKQCCLFEQNLECYTVILHVCSRLTAVPCIQCVMTMKVKKIKHNHFFLVLSVALPAGGAVLQHGSSATMCLSVFWISQRRRARASARQPYPSIIMTPQAAAMGNLPLSSRPELWAGERGRRVSSSIQNTLFCLL